MKYNPPQGFRGVTWGIADTIYLGSYSIKYVPERKAIVIRNEAEGVDVMEIKVS